MQITLGETILVSGQVRSTDGSPIGPSELQIAEQPGIIQGSYIGANRIEPEHITPDHGTVSFTATRTFPTLDDALIYVSVGIHSEAVAGQLKFGSRPIFGERSAITHRTTSMVGKTVIVQYTIEG